MADNHQLPIRALSSGALLARNTLWNLASSLAPVVAGAVAVPLLIRGIGSDRFGVLSIAWIVLGYMGLLDLGLGRALTKSVAEKIGGPDEALIAPTAWTSLLFLALLGLMGTLITCIASPWLVHSALKVPPTLQAETLRAFFLLALSVPMTMVTAGFRGLLEAQQRFRVLSLIRIPMSVFSFGGPLLVLPFSHSLVPIVGVLIAGRFITCLAHLLVCFRAMPVLRRGVVLDFALMPALFQLGGWITFSNLLGPALIYVDRFLIGGLLSLTAVAFYTAPFDMLTRIWLIPAALISVLFPAFAATFKHQPDRVPLLLARGLKYVLLAVFPVTLIVVVLSPEILGFWLGPVFAQNSAHALRWLAVGIFLNCLAQVPFTFLQSVGRADVTAKMLLVEFPFYCALVWIATLHFGIVGTAAAGAVRFACELAFLFYFTMRLVPKTSLLATKFVAATVGGLVILCLAALLSPRWPKPLFVILALLVFALAVWLWALNPQERLFFLRKPSAG